jgi:hypothetical protein
MDTPHTQDPVLDADADAPAPRTGAELPIRDLARVRALADSLDCILEPDLCELANVRASTAEAWRKRHTGPDYVIVGNRILYPRDGLKKFLQSLRRARSAVDPRGLL